MNADLGSQLIHRETRHTMTFALLCLTGVLVLCATGLFPSYAKGHQLQERISAINTERDIQQRIQPFLVALMAMEDAIECSVELGTIKQSPLPRERLLDFDEHIIALAERSTLKAVSVEVKIDEINRSDLVVVEAVLKGNYGKFHQFLLKLGQVPWVNEFQSVKISGEPNQEQMKVEFKLALE